METEKAKFLNAWPYQQDVMHLPVADAVAAPAFYETVMGFTVISREETPVNTVVLERDGLRIGLAENGGDPSQDGVAFEVDDAEAAYAEFKANGLVPAKEGTENVNGSISAQIGSENRDGTLWHVFFVIAPDQLCYWIGAKQS